MWGEALQAALLCQLLQPGRQLPVGPLNLLELQLTLPQLDTGQKYLNSDEIDGER